MDTPVAPGQTAADLRRDVWRARSVSLIAASGLFMMGLDSTILVTALPTMAADFGVRASDLSVGITFYMLAMAAMLPMTGWLADRIGARNVFAWAVAVFTLGSLFCALSDGLVGFIAARVVQGLGAGLMGSVGRLLVMRNTDNRNMLASVALMVWPALSAPILGPALGGLIVSHADWAWIFLINLPVGAVGVAATLAYIPSTKAAEPPPLDVVGLLLSAGAMISLITGLEAIPQSPSPWRPLALIALGVALSVVAWRRFSGSPRALIPLDSMRVQTFRVATFSGGWTFRMVVSAAPFVLPLMFQVGFGFSPMRSGLLLMGYFAGNFGIKPFTTFILRAVGFRQTLVWNTVVCSVANLCFLLMAPQRPDAVMFALAAFAGGSRSLQFTALDSLTYCNIRPEARSGATTLWGVATQVSNVMGIAVAAILIGMLPRLRGEAAPSIADFQVVIVAMTVLSMAGLPGFLRLPNDAGADVTGHRAR